jgi:hypothetical protein
MSTENEFNFGTLFGSRFRFCYVILNEKGFWYILENNRTGIK